MAGSYSADETARRRGKDNGQGTARLDFNLCSRRFANGRGLVRVLRERRASPRERESHNSSLPFESVFTPGCQ